MRRRTRKLRNDTWRPLRLASSLELVSWFAILGSLSSHLQQVSSLKSQQAARSSKLEDPMDLCYLANNRASESLTISESTPIGSVVGELMVSPSIRVDSSVSSRRVASIATDREAANLLQFCSLSLAILRASNFIQLWFWLVKFGQMSKLIRINSRNNDRTFGRPLSGRVGRIRSAVFCFGFLTR